MVGDQGTVNSEQLAVNSNPSAPQLTINNQQLTIDNYQSLPSPWTNTDIGSVGTAGSASESGGVFTVSGNGSNIGGSSDQFHFVYQTLSGDGEIVAEVTSQTNTNSFAKAGLMIRDGLDDDDAHVLVNMTPSGRVQSLYRTSAGGGTSGSNNSGNSLPIWLKLERVGSTFTTYKSTDGTNWTQLNQVTVTMATDVKIGMVVNARSSSQLSTATFENVSVTGGGSPTATPTNTPAATATPTHTPVPDDTPTPTPTHTPDPGGSPNPPPPSTPSYTSIHRLTLSLAGQRIAVRIRVLDDYGATTETNIHYFLTDHLGSTSQMIDHATGNAVAGSTARYLPFGDYRTEPTADDTDMGFTGHRHNNLGSNDIGLIYMNARFYLPAAGRFASADTLVPDPSNPQAFNRYSYVHNRPINLDDPSGHCPVICIEAGESGGSWETIASYDGCSSAYLVCSTPTGQHETYANPDPRQTPSAHALGISYSVETPTFIGSWEVNIAFEIVWDNDEIVLFVAPGGDFSQGYSNNAAELMDPGTNSSPIGNTIYVAQIFNTEDLPEDYAGRFDIRSFTASVGHGFIIADAFTPGEGESVPIDRTRPYSIVFGYAPGVAATYNEGSSYYFPVVPPDEQYPSLGVGLLDVLGQASPAEARSS